MTGRLTFNPAQVSLPTHLVPPPLSMSIRKPLAASPAEERETLPLPKSRALLRSRPPALRVNIVHRTDPSGPSWPCLQDHSSAGSRSVCRYLARALSVPRHVLLRCLRRVPLIYATVCKRMIRLADSTRNPIPALKTDSSQRQLQANVTAAASAHGG